MSRLDYCNSLYLNIQEGLFKKLQLIQNTAARVLTRTPKFAPILAEIKKLHWLPVKKRIQFKALCLVYKSLHGSGPLHLQKAFNWYVPSRTLRSSEAKLVAILLAKKVTWGGRRFVISAAKLWNNLPLPLRSTVRHLAFRKALKTSLFQN